MNAISIKQSELQRYCNRIITIAGSKRVNNETISSDVVTKYYTQSAFYYRKFHSPQGAMHLSVSFSSTDSHHSKLLFQANAVNEIIRQHSYSSILELGCGMGFNTIHLAECNKDKHFTAIDLTANNILEAQKNSHHLTNVHFSQGNFDSLEMKQQFDVIFAVETLCHSANFDTLLPLLAKLLRKGGRLVIFDGYVNTTSAALQSVEQTAYRLLLWGFALEQFQRLAQVQTQNTDLTLESATDYTENILPNYLSFQRGSKKALRHWWLLAVVFRLRLIPLALIKQLSAGLFGPYFLKSGYLGYYKIVLTKK